APHQDRAIETLEEFDAVVASSGTRAGFRAQAVDLADRTRELLTTDTAEAAFLGCRMRPDAEKKSRADGALVRPPVPGLRFGPYRGHLYTPGDLFASLDKATRRLRTRWRTRGAGGPGRTATSSPRCCARFTTTPCPTPS